MNELTDIQEAVRAFRLAIYASAGVILLSSLMWAALALFIIPHVIKQAINDNITGNYSINHESN